MSDETTDPTATVSTETASDQTQQTSVPETTSETTQTEQAPLQQQTQTTPETTPEQTPPTDNKWDSPENPYYKRFNDVQPVASRLYNEVKAYRDLGVDPATIKRMIDEQKQREQVSNLKPWNAGHADYNKFKQLRGIANDYRAAMQRAGQDPAKQEFVKEMYADKFSPEDLKMMQQAEVDRQEQLEQLQADPAGFIAQHVDQLIAQKFNQYEQFQNTRSQVDGWFRDPNNQPLIQKYAPDMERMMNPEVPARDKAIEFARIKAENEQLQAQLRDRAIQSGQQNARQDLLGKGQRKVHSTSQQRTDIGDPVKYLTSKGFEPGTQEFAKQLSKLNAR